MGSCEFTHRSGSCSPGARDLQCVKGNPKYDTNCTSQTIGFLSKLGDTQPLGYGNGFLPAISTSAQLAQKEMLEK